MKIKIYQIDRDKDNGSLSFLNYENTVKRTGGRIRSEIYHKVFDGDVECSGLEDVYAMFNENHPESFTGHSLSVSDIVEIENSDIVEKGFYFCDSFGFKKIDFEPSLAVESKKEQITVVICEPGKLARVANIGTELKDLQAVVGGNIETFYPYEEQEQMKPKQARLLYEIVFMNKTQEEIAAREKVSQAAVSQRFAVCKTNFKKTFEKLFPKTLYSAPF